VSLFAGVAMVRICVRAPPITGEATAAELRERDRRDRTRAASPLMPATDAVVIDSTNLSEDEVLSQIENVVQQELAP
jgi:CMP/dCMP kinase